MPHRHRGISAASGADTPPGGPDTSTGSGVHSRCSIAFGDFGGLTLVLSRASRGMWACKITRTRLGASTSCPRYQCWWSPVQDTNNVFTESVVTCVFSRRRWRVGVIRAIPLLATTATAMTPTFSKSLARKRILQCQPRHRVRRVVPEGFHL